MSFLLYVLSGPPYCLYLRADLDQLYHAMMALSALSLAHRDGAQNVDALQHYQQALPSLNATLKSTSDLSSDGALFTNLFLLLYEVLIPQFQ